MATWQWVGGQRVLPQNNLLLSLKKKQVHKPHVKKLAQNP